MSRKATIAYLILCIISSLGAIAFEVMFGYIILFLADVTVKTGTFNAGAIWVVLIGVLAVILTVTVFGMSCKGFSVLNKGDELEYFLFHSSISLVYSLGLTAFGLVLIFTDSEGIGAFSLIVGFPVLIYSLIAVIKFGLQKRRQNA